MACLRGSEPFLEMVSALAGSLWDVQSLCLQCCHVLFSRKTNNLHVRSK